MLRIIVRNVVRPEIIAAVRRVLGIAGRPATRELRAEMARRADDPMTAEARKETVRRSGGAASMNRVGNTHRARSAWSFRF